MARMSIMNPNDRIGICPACAEAGTVGTPCGSRSCAHRGYHFIPSVFAEEARDSAPDAMIGLVAGDNLLVSLLGLGGFGRYPAYLR